MRTVIDELSKGIQDEVPWYMAFADDIILIIIIDETREGVNIKLERSRDTLQAKRFTLIR